MNGFATVRGERGFTLLEMLIAMAIFGLLAVMSYSGLASVLELRSRTDAEAANLARLQKTYQVMQRDFEQLVARPVRDEFGDELASLTGDQSLQLTRGGWSNPLGRPRSTLQRVAWSFEDHQLRRYAWWVLDRAQDSLPAEELLLDDVEDMRVRYLETNGDWKEQWPAQIQEGGLTGAGAGSASLPVAVEISIEHEHFGELVWLFRAPR